MDGFVFGWLKLVVWSRLRTQDSTPPDGFATPHSAEQKLEGWAKESYVLRSLKVFGLRFLKDLKVRPPPPSP